TASVVTAEHLWASISLVVATAGCGRSVAQHPGVSSTAAAAAPVSVPQFVDRAREAGLRFVHDNGHHGPFYYPEMIGGGCGLLDVDGDGWLDLFLAQGAPLPGRAVGDRAERFSDRLYRNNHDGTFTDITRSAGVSGIAGGKKAYSIGCAVGDFDNDGHDDLLVTTYGRCLLYHNNGNGTFTDVTEQAGLVSPYNKALGVVTADFDGDGDEDIYMACDLTPDLLYVNQLRQAGATGRRGDGERGRRGDGATGRPDGMK